MDFEDEMAAIEKTKIRLAMRETRDAIPEQIIVQKNDAICRAILTLPEYKDADAIMAYVSFGNEVNPETAMHSAAAEGKRVMVPDHFGLIEVTGVFAKRAEAEDVDFVLVPGLAFGENGNRLGYGGGWYDKFSSKLRSGVMLAGLAYEEQVVRSLPAEPHDLCLDIILTDQRIIRSV